VAAVHNSLAILEMQNRGILIDFVDAIRDDVDSQMLVAKQTGRCAFI